MKQIQSGKAALEDRFAYYRRCRHIRENGEQCKGPAMKGEQICHSHAAQLDAQRRRQEERRKLLSQPGVGLGDAKSIQRLLAAMASALIARKISRKAYAPMLVQIETAIRFQKLLDRAPRPRRAALESKQRVEYAPTIIMRDEHRNQDASPPPIWQRRALYPWNEINSPSGDGSVGVNGSKLKLRPLSKPAAAAAV